MHVSTKQVHDNCNIKHTKFTSSNTATYESEEDKIVDRYPFQSIFFLLHKNLRTNFMQNLSMF